MSSTTDTDVITGAIKLQELLEDRCFTGWKDFLKSLPQLLLVEVPSSITNVIVSAIQPGDDQRDCVWLRLNAAGTFVGIFLYAAGDWNQIFPPSAYTLFRMVGDHRYLPKGYKLADGNNGKLTSAAAAQLMTQWVKDPTGTYYVIFDVTFDGF